MKHCPPLQANTLPLSTTSDSPSATGHLSNTRTCSPRKTTSTLRSSPSQRPPPLSARSKSSPPTTLPAASSTPKPPTSSTTSHASSFKKQTPHHPPSPTPTPLPLRRRVPPPPLPRFLTPPPQQAEPYELEVEERAPSDLTAFALDGFELRRDDDAEAGALKDGNVYIFLTVAPL
jgi:hypothetical protein